MKLVLAAIAAGGVIGAADQYLCLLIISILAKTGLIELSPDMATLFESWWFIGVVAVFWLVTIAPSYASALGPGVMNVVNTVVNLLSGLLVPVSAALLALASAGIIVGMHPELRTSLQAMQLFDLNGDGNIGDGLFVITGSALTASALTGAKFLAKPALSTATGTAGTVSAPVYATLENVASVVLMVLLVVLLKIDPWLLVALLATVTLVVLGVLAYAVYKMWKLAKGIGRVIHLIETRPRIGWSIVIESLVWGLGSLLWKKWARGIFRMALWVLWLLAIFFFIPGVMALLAGALVVAPVLEGLPLVLFVTAEVFTVITGLYVGLRSATSLMKMLDRPEAAPAVATAPQPSAS
jgi:hypothetical protein